MKTLERVRTRQGRCYELAFLVMTKEPGADGFTLVHGRVGPNMIEHAWIDCNDGRVYDPVRDRYVPAEGYAAFMGGAEIDARYTKREAEKVGYPNKHYGPWDAQNPPRRSRSLCAKPTSGRRQDDDRQGDGAEK